jgi:hypothetical protein
VESARGSRPDDPNRLGGPPEETTPWEQVAPRQIESTGIVRVIPPLLHGYADVAVTVALIVLPFILGFWDDTTALVFYLIVGAGGLVATLATRFEPRMPTANDMMLRPAA